MGTSSRYSGPASGNPLIPSWLEPPLPPSPTKPSDQDELPDENEQPRSDSETDGKEEENAALVSEPTAANAYPRFQGARARLNKAARTGDRDYIRQAAGSYVSRGTGGSRSASARMAVPKRTAARLIGFVNDVRDRGFAAAALEFGVSDLVGRPIGDAVASLMEAFCPQGGGIDEAIAREAWDETLLEAVEDGIVDFASLTPEQWAVLVQEFIAHSIEARMITDIGAETFSDATSVERIDEIQTELRDLISGAVRAAVGPLMAASQRISAAECARLADRIYTQAFAYLAAIEAE